ncbi:peroxisome biogenesis factor 2-like isoform X1 [Euwallacea fornicatus]|uniref:peroxisome biogenesis factor 2-like isoform X1 n=2 Tax=Euwallacea fornicatus TaxID=995702 RepID=UPI00338EA0D6
MSRNNLLRVTQMNAIYLDREIEKSFQQIIEDTIKHLPPSMVSPVHTEINLLIRLGLLKYSVFDKGSTFGQQLLNIKYQDISAFKKSLYLIFSSLEYVKCRCELWNPSHSINKIFLKWHILIKILDLINTAIFLRHGVKPLLIERVLGLNQIYSSQKSARTFESKYLARELLWNGFIEILVYILPLINYYKLKRLIKDYNPFGGRSVKNYVLPNREMNASTKCAHCGQRPILPHHMGCIHIFCYICLKGNQAADSKYECPICEYSNPNSLCDEVNV